SRIGATDCLIALSHDHGALFYCLPAECCATRLGDGGGTGCTTPQPAYAEGIFIPAPAATDVVHDPVTGILYITSGSQVLRFNVETQQFRLPLTLGGNLMGVDLSPDGTTLAVADGSYGGRDFSVDVNWV